MSRQREIDKAEEYWATVDSILIHNDKFDDGSYFKEQDNFRDKFFTKGWDEYTPMNKMVKREERTWREYISAEIQYLQNMGVITIIHNNKEKE